MPDEVKLVELARAIEKALCIDAERTPGSIWADERGRQQMLIAARAAIEATRPTAATGQGDERTRG